MILMGLYLLFLTIFTGIAALVGYLSEQAYPGSGSLVAVAIFLTAVWLAWSVSVRVAERYWPEQPSEPSA